MSAYATVSPAQPTDALTIPRQTREQSRSLAHTELARFIELLALLEPDDWDKPTACTLWSVRDIVAHQASHVQLGRGFLGFFAQVAAPAMLGHMLRGMSGLDALNKTQVEKRRQAPIADIIAELQTGTPQSIEARQRASWLGRQVRMPLPPFGTISLGFLLDVILPRDMWMHRHDIAAATGKPFVQTADHDGYMIEQTVLDAAHYAVPRLRDIEVHLTLRGVSGGEWRFGSGSPVHLSIDSVDFMRRTSERLSVDDALALASSDAASGDVRRVLAVLLAPY